MKKSVRDNVGKCVSLNLGGMPTYAKILSVKGQIISLQNLESKLTTFWHESWFSNVKPMTKKQKKELGI